jgi:psp operon transcriptional activator
MVYRADGAELSRIVFDPFDSPFRPRNHDGGTTTADSGPGADSPSVRALADGLRTGPPEPSVPDDMGLEVLPLEQAVEALRVRRMRAALERTAFNQRRAAESLGLTYHQFRGYYRKLRSQLDPVG